ncbi:lysozyme inhibitor LprI family protein [Luteibacter sp. 22Crub2.1]|uniref:lysozyme inhibitor LprI family protein n=1 Tax=Luteibacter sp. 22Crub2.1 TaxID=1283288 RepID=UPI0026DB25B2|nr:lysozyme inhibitor LprI family protein [Luteibacter sp. 22Crub2.1]
MSFVRWTVASLLLFSGAPAFAASFDCSKASSQAERLVCSDPGLSAIDARMSDAYKSALNAAEEASKPRLLVEQRHWIRYVRDVCETSDCLQAAYTRRIELLSSNSRVIFNHAACDIPEGGSCRSVVTYRDSAARIDSFNQSLKKRRSAGVIVGCDRLVDLPVGLKDSNHTFGAFCVWQSRSERRRVMICNDDMNGRFAMEAVGAGSDEELRKFTDTQCYGG